MSRVYMYVVDRDFGFAPNPFHGVCTLATCKPPIRKGARVGDWVIGMGGSRLNATGRCIYAMEVTQALTFNEYWASREFRDKRPVRNGSRVMMVGDNIYHRPVGEADWQQLDSHHSLADGSPNALNVDKDTKADRVLISRNFYYFGSEAPLASAGMLKHLGFKNGIGHRVFGAESCGELIQWITSHRNAANAVLADPFDFTKSDKRYTGRGSAVA
jgi:Nucleotide modification associated domain 2